MKKICLLSAGVLLCTLVFARGIDGPIKGSSVAVTNVTGSTLFKLYYKSENAGKVKVSIDDEAGNVVFSETMTNADGFVRPYNFRELPEGQYTITVEDETGKTVEKVSYAEGKVEKLIRIQKLADENKYLVVISSAKPDDLFIYIFDQNGALIHNEIQNVNKEFAQVYNLTDVKSFSIEVADKNGVLKKAKF